MTQEATREAVEDVARTSYGRLVAFLASTSGDLAAADDALADAFEAALRTWPERGVPQRPQTWLLTVARRGMIDAARRRATATRHLPEVARMLHDRADTVETVDTAIPDTRLHLMFACANPAVDEVARSPLMLQAVLGLDAARIGSAFLVAPATMSQRLVRAKARIKEARVPFEIPEPEQMPERLGAVLDAVYAAYGTGWDAASEGTELADEALRLARLVADLLPGQPEAHGLVALLLHSSARRPARRTDEGRFVPLDRQDTTRWSRPAIELAEQHLARAYALDRVGPYQLHAAVQSVHNRRAVTGETDWAAIAQLYEGILAFTPTVGAFVAHAAAIAHTHGGAAALALLDDLPRERIAGYQPYWVARADALRRAGDHTAANAAVRIALGLTEDPAVRTFLVHTITD